MLKFYVSHKMKVNGRWILCITTFVILLIGIVFLAIFLTALKQNKSIISNTQMETQKNPNVFKPLFKFNNDTSSPSFINSNSTQFPAALNTTCDLSKPDPNVQQSRIIGGTEADPHGYPFIVSLRILRKQTLYDHFCSGVLITAQNVLTSAHCVTNTGKNKRLIKHNLTQTYLVTFECE